MTPKSKIYCTLLIDDDKFIRYYNEKIVAKHNHFNEVISVSSGKAGLEYLKDVLLGKTIKPDIIFLDLNMPAMNGWEFINEYNKLDKLLTDDIKLVILTTSSNPDDYEKSKHAAAVKDYVNKPLSIKTLNEVLEKLHIFNSNINKIKVNI